MVKSNLTDTDMRKIREAVRTGVSEEVGVLFGVDVSKPAERTRLSKDLQDLVGFLKGYRKIKWAVVSVIVASGAAWAVNKITGGE